MKTYSIHYLQRNVRQTKVLIPHEDFLAVKNIEDDKEYSIAYKKLGKGKEWFTDKSPIFDAIASGVIHCHGEPSGCIVTLL